MNSLWPALLLFLSILLPILSADGRSPAGGGSGTARIPIALILLAPLAQRAGLRAGSLLRRGAFSPLLAAGLSQSILGPLILGGALAAIFPSILGPTGGLAAAFLAALSIALGDPWPEPKVVRSFPEAGDGPRRLFALCEAQSLLSLAGGAILYSFLVRGGSAGAVRSASEALRALGELGAGAAAGLAPGLLGLLVLRRWNLPSVELATFLVAAEAGVLAARSLGGSPLAALLASGLLLSLSHRGGSPGGSMDEEPWESDECRQGLGALCLLAAAGTLALAARGIEAAQMRDALPAGAFLWAGALCLRLLFLIGIGGMGRWFRPRGFPAHWFPAIAWAGSPAAVGLGLLLLSSETAPGMAFRDGSARAVPLVAAAIALLLQGATLGAAMVRAGRGAGVTLTAQARWQRLLARAASLEAERRAIDDLWESGNIDDEAHAALKEAILAGERGVDQERTDLTAWHPSLRRGDLERAVRAALAAGREAVDRSRARGWISADAAESVARELSRRWERTASDSLRELLSGPSGSDGPRGDRLPGSSGSSGGPLSGSSGGG